MGCEFIDGSFFRACASPFLRFRKTGALRLRFPVSFRKALVDPTERPVSCSLLPVGLYEPGRTDEYNNRILDSDAGILISA